MPSLASFHIKHWILVEINTKPTACFHIRAGILCKWDPLCIVCLMLRLSCGFTAARRHIKLQTRERNCEERQCLICTYIYWALGAHHIRLIRIIRFALHSASSSYVYATIHAGKSSLCVCVCYAALRTAFVIIESFLTLNATLLMTLWSRESLLGWESYKVVTFCL